MIAATGLAELLGLSRQPVAVAFHESAPEGTPRIDATAPSGCTYWKLAADGQSFFTQASDHFGCPPRPPNHPSVGHQFLKIGEPHALQNSSRNARAVAGSLVIGERPGRQRSHDRHRRRNALMRRCGA
jgi:hypothetical protein